MKANQTAVEWLFEQVNNLDWKYLIGEKKIEIFEQAKQMEREQHGKTWDAAIKSHDARGHVSVRATCDFDDYEIC